MTDTTHQIRAALIQIIDELLASKERNRVAPNLAAVNKLLAQHGRFSLNALVFGDFALLLSPPEFLNDKTALTDFKDRLLGKAHDWKTYVLKYNFYEELASSELETYQKIQAFLTLIRSFVGAPEVASARREDYRLLYGFIHQALYEDLKLDTLPQLLLSQMGHTLLKLPFDGSTSFRISDGGKARLSGTDPQLNTEMIEPQLQYVESLFQKLEGQSALFLDSTLTSEGYLLNLR